LTDATHSKTRDSDTQLRTGHGAAHITEQRLDGSGSYNSAAHHVFDLAGPKANQRVLGGNKEAVSQDEQEEQT
jgi:hypothetical protein